MILFSLSVTITPKAEACSIGTGLAATVTRASFLKMEIDHLPDVHPVYMVSSEDNYQFSDPVHALH